MCTPTIGFARPLDRRAGFARLWAHVSLSIREAYVSRRTLIRVPKYPYKGVQSLHACPKGVQALHALQTGVQALHACSPCALLF
ncbi:hypothetical protein PCANC_11306 [Puccinia coronata f. sp. avenae]|uniref:Uncharacterized protein n=1 Tax=Puccinia coronata f. sp. avenae TaxID=200324 RepID=A0A2N5V5A6_9BASI|nr:hypothetical protein PCANC_11306 [Puccinia coronata f. sp. avenae]